jgi:hypothetical protein
LKVSPHATSDFPQLYILDPDRHVINAERLDFSASATTATWNASTAGRGAQQVTPPVKPATESPPLKT